MGFFMKLSKAFDTADHNILLEKLHHDGVRGTALTWLKSCLDDRQLNGQWSSFVEIRCGLPQGSIHWTLLFLDKNDLGNVSNVLGCSLLADDTNIFSYKYSNYLSHILHCELLKLS